MDIKNGLLYAKSHEWIEFIGDDKAKIGISSFAQESLGDIVFIDLPEVGDSVVAEESFGDVESVKAVSDILSPVSGTIVAVNTELLDSPEKINENPYENWLIEVADIIQKGELLSPEEYKKFCEEGA